MSYAFDGGFSLAGGISSDPTGILTKVKMMLSVLKLLTLQIHTELAVAYSDVEGSTAQLSGASMVCMLLTSQH